MEPDSEETQWKDKKQQTQIATGEILNVCNRKFLPLESCSAVKWMPTKSGESPPLEMFKMCGDKALSNLIWLCSYSTVSTGLDERLTEVPSHLIFSVSQ